MYEPQNQHIVPKWYLQQWSGPLDNRVQRYRWLPTGILESERKSPRTVCKKLNLYSLATSDPAARYVLENLFQKLETQAAPVGKRLVEGSLPTDERERRAWATYMLAQRLRGKDSLAEYTARSVSILESQIATALAEATDPEERNRFLYASNLLHDAMSQNATNVARLGVAKVLTTNTTAVDTLRSMHWQTIDTSGSRHRLLTSDRPIIFTAGLRHQHAQVFFPLSPTVAFVASRNPLLVTPRDVVRFCNEHICQGATETVIAFDDTQRTFIDRRFTKQYSYHLPSRVPS
jgi:hypothetical protein